MAELAQTFGLTLAAVRLHLAKLTAGGLVAEKQLPPEGPGRPRKLYKATSAAHELVGSDHSHSSLTIRL